MLLSAVVPQLMVALPFWVCGPLIFAWLLFQVMDGSYLVGIDCRLAFHFITDLVDKKTEHQQNERASRTFRDNKLRDPKFGFQTDKLDRLSL